MGTFALPAISWLKAKPFELDRLEFGFRQEGFDLVGAQGRLCVLKELQALAEGKDFFDHYDFLKQPNGTKEAPVVVTSSMPYRIVGATDPDDDSIVHWGRVEAGKPPVKIGEEWFVHKAE